MWPNRRKKPNQIKDAPIVPESLDPMRVSHVASKAVQAAILAHAEKNQDAETLLFDKLRLDAHDKMNKAVTSGLSLPFLRAFRSGCSIETCSLITMAKLRFGLIPTVGMNLLRGH